VIAHRQPRQITGARTRLVSPPTTSVDFVAYFAMYPAQVVASEAVDSISSGRNCSSRPHRISRDRTEVGSPSGAGHETDTRATAARTASSSSSHENSAAAGSTRSADSAGCARSRRMTQ
jgi:hypothetical protein